MDTCSLGEQDIIDFLVAEAKTLGEVSPRCIVVNRVQTTRSITRTVKFALVVTTNNLTLIDALIFKCLDFDEDLIFIGSEVNFQTDLEIDYLYFEAKILAKKR